MKVVTFNAEAEVYTRFDIEVTDEQYERLHNGENIADVINNISSLAHSALYEGNEWSEIYETCSLPEEY